MAARFERSIQEWYEKGRTANLEYLNLEGQKPTLKDLDNNISVIYDRLLIHSKVSIKDFYQLSDKIHVLEGKLDKLDLHLKKLQKQVLELEPLTIKDVRSLVTEIAKKPKEVEEEALRITERLEAQTAIIKELLEKIHQTLG